MGVSNSQIRPLTYPLKNTLQPIGNDIDSDEPVNQIEWDNIPNDERIAITLNLSLDEYVALASAVDVGRDIAYGQDSELIWWIWNRALIMSICQQIADCIDNDESATAQSLQQYLARNGYSRNFHDVTNVNSIVTEAEQNTSLLPAGFSCDEPRLMAISRGIVDELNESTVDLLQVIELVTSSTELAEIVTQYVPVVGIYVELAGWLQNTFAEVYEASYNQEVEDAIACALFCAGIEDCDLSLDDIMNAYAELAVDILEFPDTNDALAVLTWITEIPAIVGITIVTAFHWGVLALMRFGGGLKGFVGISDLRSTIKQLSGLKDYSYDECDCAPEETPTDYWMIYTDHEVSGAGVWDLLAGTLVSGGILSAAGNPNVAALVINDLGGSFAIKAAGTLEQRRGTTGNGSTDFDILQAYTETNLGGPNVQVMYVNFILNNTNDVTSQEALAGTAPAKSLRFRVSDGGSLAYPTNFSILRKSVVYGLCNTGQVKPAMATYIDAIPAEGTYFD